MYEKRSYWKLVVIMLAMAILPIVAVVLIDDYVSELFLTKIALLTIDMVFMYLVHVIYVNKRVYWLTGYSYQEVKAMTPEKREELSKRFAQDFMPYLLVMLLYLMVGLLFRSPSWLDIIVFTVMLIYAAVRSAVKEFTKSNG